ncbi:MAG: adenylate/guanylate cyclase domain-containing protein [Pseudomonadota bacterium]
MKDAGRQTEVLDSPTLDNLGSEGQEDQGSACSRWTLAFAAPSVEDAYRAYRNPVILQFLRWLLGVGAVLVFAGSAIDFYRLDSDKAWLLTGIRVAASLGMLGALVLTWTASVQRHLQTFIAVGTCLLHCMWLISVPIVGPGIAEYTGVLPINIMLTFLVSGLMFRHARIVAIGAAAAYAAALAWQLGDAALAPIFYLTLAALYAGFAAYVAERARREAWVEGNRSEELLLNVLPPTIAERMKGGEALIADRFDEAAVLFADIVGFTEMSSEMDPAELVRILDEIFRRFDLIALDLDLEKIKTIGDCYMVACGLPAGRESSAWRIAEAAHRMRGEIGQVGERYDTKLAVRIGIHCGPVVAGVIGRSKFIYDLWGDTVNVASRLESTAEPGAIQISGPMRARLKAEFQTSYRGEVEMKGKGMQPVWILGGRLE